MEDVKRAVMGLMVIALTFFLSAVALGYQNHKLGHELETAWQQAGRYERLMWESNDALCGALGREPNEGEVEELQRKWWKIAAQEDR